MPENAGINKVILVGRILTEPQFCTNDDYQAEYHFSLVTEEFERLEYHHVRLPVELEAKPVKGRYFQIEGRIHQERINHEAQVPHIRIAVVACSMVAITP